MCFEIGKPLRSQVEQCEHRRYELLEVVGIDA
jgi:hypothetical protein